MSTSYYRLAKPWTHLRVDGDIHDSHRRIHLWINHAKAGELMVRADEVRDATAAFFSYDGDDVCPLRTHWGGPVRKSVVTINDPLIPDDAVVRSEYGEVFTVAEIKARDGVGRTDGMPTELFGYEP